MRKTPPKVDEVLGRLAQILEVKNDTELAEALSVARTTLSSWRARDSIPYAECVDVALRNDTSLDYVLLGSEAESDGIEEELSGYRVSRRHPEKFHDRVAIISEFTDRVMRLAERRSPQPDPVQFGPVRDLVVKTAMSDDEINLLLNILESARHPDFWLDSTKKDNNRK